MEKTPPPSTSATPEKKSKKRKSLARLARDRRRALAHALRSRRLPVADLDAFRHRSEPPHPPQRPFGTRGPIELFSRVYGRLRSALGTFLDCLRDPPPSPEPAEDSPPASESSPDETPSPSHQVNTPSSSDNPVNAPSHSRFSYEPVEEAMRLSALEIGSNLMPALRLLVRNGHQRGHSISFPYPEAYDRLMLRSSGLPTNHLELLELTTKVFQRRGEKFDLDGLYRDFAVTYGRTIFDSSSPWPSCYKVIKHP